MIRRLFMMRCLFMAGRMFMMWCLFIMRAHVHDAAPFMSGAGS